MGQDPSRILDDCRFWSQVIEDSRRTLICPPELEPRLKTQMAALGLDGMVDVKVSTLLPDDTLLVVDENAMEASFQRDLQHAAASRWF